jgi:DNA-binding winged helix-turn-helix (wHTH) protein/tetratricopeptide (TPR) repeat protein
MLRFAGFELHQGRAQLQRPDGVTIKLRPKTLELMWHLASNPRKILDKQELMETVWPNVHVADDSLFQCIRELRVALGDDSRQLISVVSGRGYRLNADVSDTTADIPATGELEAQAAAPLRRRPVLAGLGILAAGLAVAILTLLPASGVAPMPSVVIMPITVAGDDRLAAETASSVTSRLTDGLATIGNIEVLSGARPGADFILTGALQQVGSSWQVEARLTAAASGEVEWTTSVSVEAASADLPLQRSRLAAGLGHDLAVHLNALLTSDSAEGEPSARTIKVVVEQATAYINQTSPERFHAAQAMLEDGLVRYPHSVDIQGALVAHLLRGVQMQWYGPEQSAAAQARAQSLIEQALAAEPDSLAVQEAYCRFLTTANQFGASLVVCARTLTFDPWNGIALYHLGLAQLQLGRFEDALASFKQADRYDTPPVSRWTWTLGVGWTYMLMGRAADALPWLERSIAITPASGRTHLLLAAAYHQLGRSPEAATAMAKGQELRPGSSALNVGIPVENASPVFLEAVTRLTQWGIAAGLPER